MTIARRPFPRPAAILLAVALLGAGGFWTIQWRQTAAPPSPAPVAGVESATQPARAETLNPGFEKLKGKWQRPDGGYVVEIRNVEPGGKMDAAYFNPRSIFVAKAEATQEGALTKVFIELRDRNYPGSTYNLSYEAENDQLTGIYYQAALRQRYEVVFARMK